MKDKSIEPIELFVPGRLCLFGEHSDWAAGHRRQNSEIEKGYAIIAPTNQGNYARVRRLDKPVFRFKSVLSREVFEEGLNEDTLRRISEQGGFYSYVAGVALETIVSYNNQGEIGLEIDNYKSDLPEKKGLSSSASICVLTAKAFNHVFGLKWTVRREMDVAYLGETATPSRCGRLDQACAYNAPVLMTFDADRIRVEELKVGKDMHLLIVDLNGKKDTRKILADLNVGFPWPRNEQEKRKQEYLGRINKSIVFEAVEALSKGDAQKAGLLMSQAQERFEEYLAPSCPEQLGERGSPKLHQALYLPGIKDVVYGGKGVGSQGDGSAQFICKSREARETAKKILEEELGVSCLDLDLKKTGYIELLS